MKTIPSGNGWHTVISRRQNQFLSNKKQQQPSTAGWRRSQHRSSTSRFNNTNRNGDNRNTAIQQQASYFPRKNNQVHYHHPSGKFPQNTNSYRKTRLYASPINYMSTIDALVPTPSFHALMTINGQPNTKTQHPVHSSSTVNSFVPTTTENLMANKNPSSSNLIQSNLNPPTFKPNSPNAFTPQKTYAQVTTPPLFYPNAPHNNQSTQHNHQPNSHYHQQQLHSQRFQSPPWPHFTDNYPWPLPSIQANLTPPQALPHPLPLPPNPASPCWKGRCYNCLKFGHDQKECKSDERICAKCWGKGHEAKHCAVGIYSTHSRFDPLSPQGNLGEDKLPTNRPRKATVFIPETNQMRHDVLELNRAIVIDARLRATHSTNKLQSALMAICKSDFPFALTHMTGSQYFLLLPSDSAVQEEHQMNEGDYLINEGSNSAVQGEDRNESVLGAFDSDSDLELSEDDVDEATS